MLVLGCATGVASVLLCLAAWAFSKRRRQRVHAGPEGVPVLATGPEAQLPAVSLVQQAGAGLFGAQRNGSWRVTETALIVLSSPVSGKL